MRIILSLLFLAGLLNLSAKPISPQEALARVTASDMRQAKSSRLSPKLLSTIEDSSGFAAIYIYSYSGDEGFMLLSADDAVPALLGYSETNSFAIGNPSADIKWWLNLYSTQIEDARDLPPYREMKTRAGEWAPVSPLLTTTWDQGSPYNNQCPRDGVYRCVTGCVATAMAQVMNYWKYPTVGKGSISYRPQDLEQDLSIDFSETPFDWDNMLDSYKGSTTTAQKNAVATLMKACGYSVKMNYTAWASGAKTGDVRLALENYFGYDKGASAKVRSSYTNPDDWNALVYNDLVKVGPVIYAGQSNEGGHCFVCDGYDGNGFFHINWGWGGLSDGYFLLNELTPHDIGAGGHYGGYNMSQEIIVGIMPPVGRLTLVGEINVDNQAPDTGNVSGWGKTIRLNDFHNIMLSMKIRVSGGVVYSPIYVSIYETDPVTLKNGTLVYEQQSVDPLHAPEGMTQYNTVVDMKQYDVSKLYTLYVAYELNGQRTTIGNLRMAASSGVGAIGSADNIEIHKEGQTLYAEAQSELTLTVMNLSGMVVGYDKGSNPRLDLSGLGAGLYIAKAQTPDGQSKTIKLLLK